LQDRDLRVMEELALRRAETLETLHGRHFPGRSLKRTRNRLGELASAGYLERETIRLAGQDAPSWVYTLGRRAPTALARRSLLHDDLRGRRWNPTLHGSSMPHQIAVNQVLDKLGAQATREHLLPTVGPAGSRSRPDATYRSRGGDGHEPVTVYVEVDLGHYSRHRIREKIAAFLSDERAGFLLLFCHNRQRERWLVGVVNELGVREAWRRLDLRTLDDVKADWAPAPGGTPRVDLLPEVGSYESRGRP